MTKYIGTKIVEAEPATKGEYWEAVKMPEDARKGEAGEPGYLVIYPDGYVSWSPQDVFEVAYHALNKLTFGEAFEMMKRGCGMRLPQWQEDVVIRVQYPDIHNKMTAPYLYAESRSGCISRKETMIELFSEEWQIVE